MKPKIRLSKKQMELIEEEVEETRAASVNGIPGILMAQISTVNGDVYVGFVDREKALKIQDIQGVSAGKQSIV